MVLENVRIIVTNHYTPPLRYSAAALAEPWSGQKQAVYHNNITAFMNATLYSGHLHISTAFYLELNKSLARWTASITKLQCNRSFRTLFFHTQLLLTLIFFPRNGTRHHLTQFVVLKMAR